MILYTGDVHGDGGRFSPEGTPGEEKLGKGDYLAVAGDAGLVFWNEDLPRYAEGEALLDALEEKPYTILFVDGNPSGVKCALALQGTIKNVLRLPLVPARKETEAKIAEFLKL